MIRGYVMGQSPPEQDKHATGVTGTGHRVSSDYIRGMLKGAVLQGYDAESILRKAGLSASCYNDPAASIDGEEFFRLLATLQMETQDVFMGFTEQPGKPGMQAAHTKLWVQSKNLGEAIRNSTHLREQMRNDVRYDYINDEEHHTFSLGIKDYQLKPDVDPFLFYWHRLMGIYRSYCWLVGKRIKLNRVGFAMPEPKQHDDLYAVFHCDVLFEQDTNYLCFDKSYLQAPIVRTETELVHYDIYVKYPNWFDVPGYDYSWSRQVEDVIVRYHREGKSEAASLSTVAQTINISERALRRLLQRENETFKRIKERVHLNLAVKMLISTDMPVTRIANELGYLDPGSFTRAFQGWTDCTPSRYRKQHTGDRALVALASANSIPEHRPTHR